jgi:hypothetical protein
MAAVRFTHAFFLLIFSGTLFSGSVMAQEPSSPTFVPFKDGVEVKINGHGPYQFGLDTGASVTLLTPELSRELSLPVTSHSHTHGATSRADDPSVDVMRIDDLLLAGHLFHHAIGVAHTNASPLVKNGSGLLGMGLFQEVVVRLDYPANKLSISEQSLPPEDGKNIFKYNDVHLRPYVDVVLGGVPANAGIDTGAKDSGADVTVPPDFASRLHLQNLVKMPYGWTDINGRSHEMSRATLDGDLTIGSIVVHNPTLLITDSVPFVNLGSVLNKLVITLDPRNHRVKFEMP